MIRNELTFVDRWEIKIKPKVRSRMTPRGREALVERLKDHAGRRYSIRHFRTRANAEAWLATLPEGLSSRCEVGQVCWLQMPSGNRRKRLQ
jgi:hypothetical protein